MGQLYKLDPLEGDTVACKGERNGKPALFYESGSANEYLTLAIAKSNPGSVCCCLTLTRVEEFELYELLFRRQVDRSADDSPRG